MLEHGNDLESCDICIVGAGPVGLYLALNLAQAGLTACAFEALSELIDEPRAIAHIPIIFPEYERVGILKPLKAVSVANSGVLTFRRTQDRKIIEQILPLPNRPGASVCPQKRFCEILLEKLKETPNAKVEFGQKAVLVEENVDGLFLKVEDVASKETKRVKCKYLVGADGAKSMIRKSMGLRYEGETLPFKLIAADMVFPFEQHGFHDSTFMLDPDHYGNITVFGETDKKETVWRVSVGFPLSMSDQEVMDALPDKFQTFFSELKPGSYRLLQAQPYDAHQFCVPTLKSGSVLLVGDSAHLANPYSGQTLACGMYDASSLAPCLSAILKDGASEKLLEEWSQDRVLKFRNILDPLSRRCFEAVRDADAETIGQRHPSLKARRAGPSAPPPPSLATDFTKLKSWYTRASESLSSGSSDSSHSLQNPTQT